MNRGSDPRAQTAASGSHPAGLKKVYAVTMRAQAEMVVWVEARSAAGAKLLADAGEYDVMTEWTPRDYSKVKATKARLSSWPDDSNGSVGTPPASGR